MTASMPPTRASSPLMSWALLIWLLPWIEAGGQAQNRPTAAKPTAPPPPMPAQAGSPVDFFRQLITANPQEREQLLMRRAPDSPELRKKLEDYALYYQRDLSAEERELRLRNMELRYHLTALLRVAPSNRMERLKLVPDRDRPPIEDRLEYWDSLSSEQQQEVLNNSRLIGEIIGHGIVKRPLHPASLTGQASNQFVRIEQQLVHWQMLPDERRAKVQQYFTNIFELTDQEKARDRLLSLPWSEEERQLMEQTLAQFKRLSPAQRNTCVQNFSKLALLSPAERRAFLVNAGEWEKMSPEDREAWRKLISKVPPLPQHYRRPPLPPGLRQSGMLGSSRTGSTTTVQRTN